MNKNGQSTLRDAFRLIRKHRTTREASAQEKRTEILFSAVMCIIAAVFTVLNIEKHYTMMALSTGILMVGFGVAILLFAGFHQRRFAKVLVSLLVSANFSIYVLGGENEGFAALWVLLVPIISMNMLGIFQGIVISAYFQTFLVAVFYTPLYGLLNDLEFVRLDVYNAMFRIRFPVLFLAMFVSSVLLSGQRIFYYLRTEETACTDLLTGLGNRRMMADLSAELDASSGLQSKLTVISCDVDRLKEVNDSHGHEAGDELLAATADCLRQAFPNAYGICRMGGDEFVVLLTCDLQETERMIEDFHRIVNDWSGGISGSLSVSCGCASHRENPGSSCEELYRIADQRMYTEKKRYYDVTGYDRRNVSAKD